MRRRRSTAPRSCTTRHSARRSDPANWKFRRCAVSAAACCISSMRKARFGRLWDIDFSVPEQMPAERRRRPHGDRSRLAIDALRRNAVVAVVLQFTAGRDQDAAARRHRSGRHRPQPGGPDRRRRAAHRAECLAEPADAVVTVSDATISGPACSTSRSPPTTSSRPSRACAPTMWRCCRSRKIITTIWKRAPICRRSGSRFCAPTIFFTIGTRSGEYLQAYTRSFDDLFFFEIVERRAYKGFGAVNSAIRLAAQARELGSGEPPVRALT